MVQENATLCDILQRRAREQAQELAYVFLDDDALDEHPITYAELDRQARAIASRIQTVCKPGDRAILLYPQGLEFIAAFFGCLYAGVIAVPAYPPRAYRNLSRLQAIVEDCQAVLALTTEQLHDALHSSSEVEELQELHWLATDQIEVGTEDHWQTHVLDGDTIAFLQYTSGSTGTPNGVMVSHGNLMHNSQCIRDRWGHSSASVGVSWLPQFHDLGLIIGILQPVYVGYKAVLLSPIAFIQEPLRWLDVISRYRGTTTSAPNFAFDLCVLKIPPEQRETLDLSCVETVMDGAEPVLFETLKNFEHAFAQCGFRMSAFRGGYGLAEGTVFVTTSHRAANGPAVKMVYKEALEQHRVEEAASPGPDTMYIVGCGPTSDDQELVIVDPKRHTRCRPGQIGEIWFRGPSVAVGYWQRPAETTSTFEAILEDTQQGPFLRTGDLGFLEDGELYITGRIKDLIIVRGRNHYPQDLERTVERTHRCLRINCTAAFSVRDGGEERVVVVQELRRDHAGVDLEQLLADIYKAVATEHELALAAIVLIAERDISKTSSGKIQRSTCRKRYQDGDFQVIEEATFAVAPRRAGLDTAAFLKRFFELDAEECRVQVESYLIQTIRTARPGISYVDIHDSLMRLGIDSLGITELKSTIESELDIGFPHATLMEASLRELAEIIIQQLMAKEADRGDLTLLTDVNAMSDAEVNDMLNEMLASSGSTDA